MDSISTFEEAVFLFYTVIIWHLHEFNLHSGVYASQCAGTVDHL